jgi:hypothetical protein
MIRELLTTTLALGFVLGLAFSYTIRDWLAKRTDIKLLTDNKYLREEVSRLRAQVALHIGREPGQSMCKVPGWAIVPQKGP